MENQQNKYSNKSDDDGKDDETVANVFAKSGKLLRSPPAARPMSPRSGNPPEDKSERLEERQVVTLSQTLSPNPKSGDSHSRKEEPQPERNRMTEVKKKIDELYDFLKDRHNVHHKIKAMVTAIKYGSAAAEREQIEWRKRAENAEKTLKETIEKSEIVAAEPGQPRSYGQAGKALEKSKEKVKPSTAVETPKGSRNSRTEKRERETPGEEEEAKKLKQDQKQSTNEETKKPGVNSGWRVVENKSKKKKIIQEKNKEKLKPRKERRKGDALIVEVTSGMTYAALLNQVKNDPELKELGDNVIKTRRTQKGDMLFELKRDSAIKSITCKQLIEKSLGQALKVKTLIQETVVECRNLDETTTVDELQEALKVQLKLDEEPMSIRMRAAYGGMQAATIKLRTDTARKVLEAGKIRVGWSVCSLRAIQRVERCYRCMGFGHHARNCKEEDRSEMCIICSEKGHTAKDCKNPPKCMLCKIEGRSDHATGGFRCPAYKKAIADKKKWR